MKSVTGDTKIMIDVGYGEVKVVEIGPWIDKLLSAGGSTETGDMEILPIEPVYIPTVDPTGHVSWGEITHVTRHSPTNILYKINTRYGREVIVTDSKSLLVWNFLYSRTDQVQASTVKVGDYVPVTMKLHRPPRATLKRCMCYNTKLALFNRKGIFCNIVGSSTNPEPLDAGDLMIRGDVVLDKVISIEVVPGDRYRYVYDLTVPSTTNFCLANGLHVVDTADWRNRVGSC
jgi:intein/homing endonuclease